MPRRLERSITRALRDETISREELSDLVKEAKLDDVLSPDERAKLTELLALHGDRFDEKTRAAATRFLEGGRAVSSGPVADPNLSWDTTGDVTLRTPRGATLVVDGFHWDDVVQNQLGDCFLLASLSALAAANPKALEDALTDHGDGTYTVRFFEKQGRDLVPVNVTVDADLPTRGNGALVYGHSRTRHELWPALIEKAYATWKGGYGELSLGGFAGDALTALTGAKSDFYNPISNLESRELWSVLQRAQADGRPMVTGTEAGVGEAGTASEGLVPMHMYSVIGVTERNGEKLVTLRNPYGAGEPGKDKQDDGVFQLTLRDYRKFFGDLYLLP